MQDAINDNPLLKHEALPRFDVVTVEHIAPAMASLLPKLESDIAALEASPAPTWETVAKLSAIKEPLDYAWNIVSHLMAVQNSPALREAHGKVQKDVVAAEMRVQQSLPLYNALRALKDSPEWASLSGAQHRVVELALKEAQHKGVALVGEKQERFKAIELELAELSTKFSNQLIDANKAWALTLTTKEEIKGLPSSLLAQASAAHVAAQKVPEGTEPPKADAENGPWRITLDIHMFQPFMEHSPHRELREQIYRQYLTRASAGELNNMPLIVKTLELKREKARLLGFNTFAELSLDSKMAPSVAAVDTLLDELRNASADRARAELVELAEMARAEGGLNELANWDVMYWAERMREKRFNLKDDELRPYFALPRALDALFSTTQRLFGVTIRPADGETSVWDPTVRFFRIADASGKDVAAFYLDSYARPANKRGGAWMSGAHSRKKLADGTIKLPVAYLVCNQSPPVGEVPSLMTFREVETLFHEFGHGLQHMLTQVDISDVAGIHGVEWDAVELPSQFMENWCYHAPTLVGTEEKPGLAVHYSTGERLPEEKFRQLLAARTYRAGWQTLRQVYFATLDMTLYHHLATFDEASVLETQKRVAQTNTVIAPLPEDRFLCSFMHIFAGGYAAGYYSYKWAEVLAADSFGAFQEVGLDNAEAVAATGRRFRDTILALGGSVHPMEVFRAFRGREPTTAALLRQSGLTE